MEFHPGDWVKMVFNEPQVLVDFHPLGHKDDHHTVITGHIAPQMKVGQEQVVVKMEDGQSIAYPIAPLMRSKTASMPVGAPAVFLVDETDRIVDVTYGDVLSLEQIKREYRQMSSPKSPHIRVNGIVMGVMADGRSTIRTADGEHRMYPVRPYAAEDLASVRAGDEVTLPIDSGQHVLDFARPNTEENAK
ncbi:MAG: hypothetical protein CV089_00430 [Nitrospira sp. WS110]|nr:hypothetical protein [Nitrospira sp. WS110]